MFIEVCDTEGHYHMIAQDNLADVNDNTDDELQSQLVFKDHTTLTVQCEYSVLRQLLAPRSTI